MDRLEVNRASSWEGKTDMSGEERHMQSKLEHTRTCRSMSASHSLWIPSSNDATDLLEKLMPFVIELNMLLGQDLGKLVWETWWELEELEEPPHRHRWACRPATTCGPITLRTHANLFSIKNIWMLLLHFCLPNLIQNVPWSISQLRTIQGGEFWEM